MCESYIFEIKLRKTFLDLDSKVHFSVSNIKNFLTMAFPLHVCVCCQKGLVPYFAERKVVPPLLFKSYRTTSPDESER